MVHPSNWTDVRRQRAKDLWMSGLSASQVAKQIGQGVTRNAVIGVIWRANIKRARAAPVVANSYPKDRKSPTNYRRGGAKKVFVPPAPPLLPPRPLVPTLVASQAPRPWTTRAYGECAFPVDTDDAEISSCCNPSGVETYCPAHRKIMYGPPASTGKQLARSLRRFVG